APAFDHHPAASLPIVARPGAEIRIVAGSAYGATSPVTVRSSTLYADVALQTGAQLALPDQHAERAAYVVEGAVAAGGAPLRPGALTVFAAGAAAALRALEPSRLVLIGGAPLDGPRHIWWNFVSSSEERIQRAKADWRDGRFAKVPGDDREWIPLPEER